MRTAKYDLTDQLFGHLYVLRQVEPPEDRPQHGTYWLCRCEKCKGKEVLSSSELTGRRRAQCRDCTVGVKDLTGKVYGVWKVLRRAEQAEIPEKEPKKQQSWWRVQCTLCGREDVRGRNVLVKLYKQCPCIDRRTAHPRPFVEVKGGKLQHKRKTKQCKWCGKVFELEHIGQWGWNIGNDLFCTYKCMRKAETTKKDGRKR